VYPPIDRARVCRGAVLEADGTEGVPDRVAHWRPHLEARIVRGDPKRLEQEPGERKEEEAGEEDPVTEPVTPRLVTQRLGGLDGPPVAQPERPQDPALDREVGKPDHEDGAEDVEEERVDLVEPPVPEVEAQDRLGEVVLEGENRRSREEHHEAVEDEEMADAGQWVAPFDPRVGAHDLGHPDEALARVLDLPRAAPAPVLEDEAKDAVDEDRDREDDQPVPEGDLPGFQSRKRVPRRGHVYSFSSSSAISKRSATAP
jgi:hypothetical protein